MIGRHDREAKNKSRSSFVVLSPLVLDPTCHANRKPIQQIGKQSLTFDFDVGVGVGVGVGGVKHLLAGPNGGTVVTEHSSRRSDPSSNPRKQTVETSNLNAASTGLLVVLVYR